MSDQPNRDHRCRTCEHWGPSWATPKDDRPYTCSAALPFWAEGKLRVSEAQVQPEDGDRCDAYTYSYRRARLVRP